MEIAFGAFGKNDDGSMDTVKDFTVVNTLRLSDEYLYGLGEMPSGWFHYVTSGGLDVKTTSALQAQTIAARTYALQKVRAQTSDDPYSIRAACQCHVYASTNDQAFIGYVKEASYRGDKWVAAVNATRDTATATLPNINQRKWKVLTYNNAPIQAATLNRYLKCGDPLRVHSHT
jgi:SpoIID/LytB domain protein